VDRLGRDGLGGPMIAHLRHAYSAPGMRGARGHAARAFLADAIDRAAERRPIPEDRDDPETGAPLAFAVDGRAYHDDAFGPGWARSRPCPIDAHHMDARHRRMAAQVAAERRWHALDRIAQRQHV
jgi:hypothetical protein